MYTYVLFFLISHSIIVILFFFILYLIEKNFLSNSIIQIKSISNFSSLFYIFIMLSIIIFSGFPLTIKFFGEFFFFINFFQYSIILSIMLLLFFNFFSIISFNKFFFNIFFGLKKDKIKIRTFLFLYDLYVYIYIFIFFFLFFTLNLFF